MTLEGGMKALGEHGRSVLSPFSIPHMEAAKGKVELFDPEAQGLRETQATAVEKMGNEPVWAGGECREQAPHFVAREHRGESLGTVGSVEGTDIIEHLVEHLFVEEHQGIEGLVLGGGRHVAVRGQMVQERPDVLFIEMARVSSVVEANEAFGPADVRLFCVIAVLAALADLPYLVEELGGVGVGLGHGREEGFDQGVWFDNKIANIEYVK